MLTSKIKVLAICFMITALLLSFINPVFADNTILGWNDPADSSSTWSGWTWYPDGANDYGSVGWRKDGGQFYSGSTNWYPRLHEKTDYGMDVLGAIDTTERAPSTTSGSSLKVYDSGDSSTYQASYWYMWGDSFGTKSMADGSTDRLSFYLKVRGFDSDLPTAGILPNANMHFGTYLCWEDGGYGGESCPKEANGQHYYHYLTVNDGAWLHVQLDQHPTHRRGMAEPDEPNNDPAFADYDKHYFENMNSFYLEIRAAQSQKTAYWIDEVNLWNQTQTENEDSIGSNVWIGYWPATDKWEIGFGSVWPGRPMQASFEIRWSISPITNTNFSSATIVEPEYYERGTTNTILLSDSGWSKNAWTRFELPDEIEGAAETIYFAIRDVSAISKGDGYDSPTADIKTINYTLSSPSSILPPKYLRTISTD